MSTGLRVQGNAAVPAEHSARLQAHEVSRSVRQVPSNEVAKVALAHKADTHRVSLGRHVQALRVGVGVRVRVRARARARARVRV